MEPGFVYGKYNIRRQIGRGGMGIVYLAEDTTLMRLIAIKVLDRSVTSSPHFEQRFIKEARLVASLNHANIVPIYALNKIDEDWVLEMPYIEGGSLMDAEEQGALDLRQTLKCVRDVLLALAACHEADIIHRDVKPSNILLNEQRRGMLSDFGLAKLLSLHQQESVQTSCSASLFIGTPRYAPPESWEEGVPTKVWDIYSTGMVLYEAIAGSTPYDAQTPLSLMKQMLERPIPPLQDIVPSISAPLGDLVDSMLARNPNDRPQDVADVLEQFWSLPELSEDSTSPPVLVKPDKRRPLKKYPARVKTSRSRFAVNKTGAAVAAVFLVMLLIAASVLALVGRRGETTLPPAISETPGTAENAPGIIAFEGVNMERQEVLGGACLGIMTSGGQPWQLLQAGNGQLWLIEMLPLPGDMVALRGNWADYDREAAMVFRHGTVEGKGRWIRQMEDLSLSLAFEHPESTATWNQSFLLKRVDAPASGAPFLCEAASTEALSALVYNELLPRDLPWVSALQRAFVDLGLAQTTVLRHDTNDAPLTLDGMLREPVWRSFLQDAPYGSSRATPVDDPEGSFLRAFHDGDALYIGIHVGEIIPVSRMVMTLQTTHPFSPGNAERWSIQVDFAEVITARKSRRGIDLPWQCDWEVVLFSDGTLFEAEIKIPFGGVSGPTPPQSGTRWLLNCQVGHFRPSGITTIAQWGSDILDDTACGLVLAFD